jgi:exopolysaccharide biosynthesis predicted pyruvyltransferase EpsI
MLEIDATLTEWAAGEPGCLFYPNPGNAGDALIAVATWQCFDRLGMTAKVVSIKDLPEHARLVLGGGGNLVPHYRKIAHALEACLERKVERCLLLPHTIRGHETLLRRLDHRFTLLCRDRESLEHVRRHAPDAIALPSHDMVLSLDIPALENRALKLRHKLALLFDSDWQKYRRRWRRALARQHPDPEGTLTILRSDVEAASAEKGLPDLDLMRHYTTQCDHRAGCEQVAVDIIALLRQARKVRTDRLHVALPAAMLGLKVEILDNNYGKLAAVWSHSLEAAYPNAILAGTH